jgi:phosphoglycerate kinase
MNYLTLKEIPLKNKLVLLRIDINSPVNQKRILDSPRMIQSAKTISFLLKKGVKLVIIAHQGRKNDSDFLPLSQHAKLLSKHSKFKIDYLDYLFEKKAIEKINNLKPKKALLLKNIREYQDETNIQDKKNKYYQFSKLFDLYVNDSFSVSHRAQGSIIIPPKVIPGIIGLNMEIELSALKNFHLDKKTNNLFFIGGSKIEDYLPIFENLKNKNNKIVTSGVLANLFLIVKGLDLQYEKSWLKQKGYLSLLPKISSIYKKYKKQIILPLDFATGQNSRKEYLAKDFPKDKKIWDIGSLTIEFYKEELNKTNAVFMKGPLGYSENNLFKKGTVEILKEVSNLTKEKKLYSLLGGGHLTTTITQYNLPDYFSYISLSGGALIAYISGKELPGLVVLEKNQKKII